MPQIINSNVASLNAQRNLNTSQSSLNTSLTRLSSGLRINSAKDDAAGLAISERMTAQIRGLNQAARNANDGISLAQTAEGALGEIGNNLQRIRELAVQSANASNSTSDRASLQAEVAQLSSEITRVASQTQFNGLNLLDGSFQNQSFQVGANANQTIDITSIRDARASALGSHTLATAGTAMNTVVVDTAANTTANGNGVTVEADLALTTDKGTVSNISYAADSDAADIASAINTAASGIGITATASNSTTLDTVSAAGDITFNLNGTAISATITATNDLSALAAAINGSQSSTGVTASFTTVGDKSSLTLSTTDGRDIVLDTYANTGAAGATVSIGGSTVTEGGTDSATVTGSVNLTSSQGQIITTTANADVFAVAGTNISSFQSVALQDVSTAAGAQNAIEVLDAALSQINSARGDLGAIQNRFSSTIANLQSSAENLSASRSRIQDADFAAETANMTRGQILQQAGVAILAQANSLPNNVLSLLR
ncbi:flagellin [Nitrosomonas sp. Nm166]|uniref:flagellin N-terminal helical domain-containing protein n=1 Tax=Nitrosomonas sp. Nm166 TaxID=1881054 RepID=UPI0008E97E7E|nr:flagellin [Nitrosomonas sp. Nm166]SFD90656.1 flagellin [Nitrosomonas sp. Nm166]